MSRTNIRLIEPTGELKAEFLEMAEEYSRAGDARYQSALEDFPAYLERLANNARGANLPANRVASSSFWLVSDRRVFGQSSLRHRLTTELEREGGHIGYDVRPSERRKGFGALILKLMLEKAKDSRLNRVLLTCDTENLASAKIIEKNGGVLSERATSEKSGKLISRYWIAL